LITLETKNFSEHSQEILSLRYRVFSLEQGVDPDIDIDGLDDDAVQILALDNGTPVGTGRMLADGHIGRIAVLAEYRKAGIGKQIMSCLIEQARNNELDQVFLGAQVSAVPFYEKLGFCHSGEDYMEANILHTPMELSLKTNTAYQVEKYDDTIGHL